MMGAKNQPVMVMAKPITAILQASAMEGFCEGVGGGAEGEGCILVALSNALAEMLLMKSYSPSARLYTGSSI
jgi:hypothetical protein